MKERAFWFFHFLSFLSPTVLTQQAFASQKIVVVYITITVLSSLPILKKKQIPNDSRYVAHLLSLLLLGLSIGLGTWIYLAPDPGGNFGWHQYSLHNLKIAYAYLAMLPLAIQVAWIFIPKPIHNKFCLKYTSIFVILPALTSIVVFEAILIISDEAPSNIAKTANASDRSYWHYLPNQSIRYQGVTHRYNSWGIRGPEPTRSKKKSNVLLIGDSIPFGAGIPERKVFPWLAERLLQKSNIPVQIVNGALPSYSTEQMRNLYRDHLSSIPHDILVLSFYINDVNRELAYRKNERLYSPVWTEWNQDAFYSCRLCKLWFLAMDFSGREFFSYHRRSIDAGFKDSLNVLKDLDNISKSKGAKFAILNVPSLYKKTGIFRSQEDYRFHPFNVALENWAKKNKILYHDTLNAILGKPLESLRLGPFDNHYNERQHRLIAKELNQELKKWLTTNNKNQAFPLL